MRTDRPAPFDPAFDPVSDPDPAFGPGLGGDPLAGPAGDVMFGAVPALMGLLVAVVVVIGLVRLVRAGATVATNSAAPRQSVTARVVGRRTRIEGGGEVPVRTRWFATFQTATGERVELAVPQREYGRLVEGDEGQLTHQGTWFRSFERRRVIPLDGTWEAPAGPTLPPPTGP